MIKNKIRKFPDYNSKSKYLYFGIARNEEERKLVINEANQINDVEEVVSSIFLVSDLTNNQRLKN